MEAIAALEIERKIKRQDGCCIYCLGKLLHNEILIEIKL